MGKVCYPVIGNVMNNSSAWPVSLICLLIAFYLGFQYTVSKNDASRSEKWTHVRGVIDLVGMTKRIGRGGVYNYSPHVAYHFKYKRKVYYGHVIAFPDPQNFSEEGAQAFRLKYPEGRQVSIYFDPNSPTNSCLQCGDSGNFDSYLWGAIGLAAVSVILLFVRAEEGESASSSYLSPS